MATIGKKGIGVSKTLLSTFSPAPLSFKEAASQTFKSGGLLQADNGYLSAIAASDPPAGLIFGIAAEPGHDAAANGDKDVLFYLAHPDIVFVGNITNAGSDVVLAQTHTGMAYGLYYDSANKYYYVDVGDEANKRVRILDVAPGSKVGDTNARVQFVFCSSSDRVYSTS